MDIRLPSRPRISYANVNPEKATRIIESYIIKGDPLLQFAVGHFGDENLEFTNGVPAFFDLPMLKPQVRVVLRNCGFIDPEEIDHYLANEGYAAIQFIKGAAEKAGTTDPDKFVKALEGFRIMAPQGEMRINPENHLADQHIYLCKIQNRKYNVVKDFGLIVHPNHSGCSA